KKETKVELSIDSRAQIQGIPDSEFSSPRELGVLLASNRECQMCVARQLYRYAFGRTESAADEDVLQRGFRAFKDSQFQFQELMIAMATSLAAEVGSYLTGGRPEAAVKEVGTKRLPAGKRRKS